MPKKHGAEAGNYLQQLTLMNSIFIFIFVSFAVIFTDKVINFFHAFFIISMIIFFKLKGHTIITDGGVTIIINW